MTDISVSQFWRQEGQGLTGVWWGPCLWLQVALSPCVLMWPILCACGALSLCGGVSSLMSLLIIHPPPQGQGPTLCSLM